jgi:hypothetical protein
MSRRSSNTVKRERKSSHHPLDRNGIPILETKQRNRLEPSRKRLLHSVDPYSPDLVE